MRTNQVLEPRWLVLGRHGPCHRAGSTDLDTVECFYIRRRTHGMVAMCANVFRQTSPTTSLGSRRLPHPFSTLRLFFTENTPETPLA